jgi:ABC-type spermidine/putrescine transport system permease subunit II
MSGRAGWRLGRWIHGTVVALICLFLVAPAAVVIPLSFAGDAMTRFPPQRFTFQAYSNFINGPGWINATVFSLEMAALVMVFAVALGTATAYGVTARQGVVKKSLMVLILMPIVVPPIIYAISIYALLAQLGILGTFTGFVVVNVVLASPYAIITIRAGMESLDWSLLRAAAVLGASPTRVATRVAAPLLIPSLVAAGLFTFLASFDEVVVAQFISGPFAVPLAKRMWDGILYRWDPAISAISTIQIALTIVTLIVFALLRRSQVALAEPTTMRRTQEGGQQQ